MLRDFSQRRDLRRDDVFIIKTCQLVWEIFTDVEEMCARDIRQSFTFECLCYLSSTLTVLYWGLPL